MIEAIHFMRMLMKLYRNRKKGLPMVLIDLKKTYNRIPREILWELLENKEVPVVYIRAIKDTYEGAKMSIRTSTKDTEDFPINIGLHQG